jgi:Ni,Fe-hydrogenase III large subunit
MIQPHPLLCRNCEPVKLENIPILKLEDFAEFILATVQNNDRLTALFAQPSSDSGHRLFAIATARDEGALRICSARVADNYPSLTPRCTQAYWFEREIAETWGITPAGHPWLKPIRFTSSPIGEAAFYSIFGHESHEVAVGPVHAGVIEPGHFRFSCEGEIVHHLEISLGYQHRGVEQALINGPTARTIHYMETLAGDTSVGHGIAYCQNMETLSHCRVSLRGMIIRSIALELERLANHAGDLGALAGDVGYLPVSAHCGRIRGDFLNLTAHICGNRLGRGIARPGGVAFDLNEEQLTVFRQKLEQAFADVDIAAQLLWETPSIINRFDGTGTLSAAQCKELGIVGPPARAAGIEQDVRLDYPSDVFRFAQIPVSLWHAGDVFGRAHVRWLEIVRSVEFIRTQLGALPTETAQISVGSLVPDSLSIALVEGWRGEICHVACTGSDGRFKWYKVIDPSFHNWAGLALAMRNQQISDFPLCNKSFNLSYCGHDL